jgi:hypothetical protein
LAIVALVLASALLGLCALAGALMAGDIVTPSKTVLLDVVALVAASVAASTLTALSLLRQLTELRDEALELARRPPWVMDRLSPGGHLDIEAAARTRPAGDGAGPAALTPAASPGVSGRRRLIS